MPSRIPFACLLCRERKVKCDGEKPSCGHCQRLTWASCTYPEPGAQSALRARAERQVSRATQTDAIELPSPEASEHNVPELPLQEVGQILLENYFHKIHNANLLFHRTTAFQLYAQNRVPEYLLQAIFAQAAIFLRNFDDGRGLFENSCRGRGRRARLLWDDSSFDLSSAERVGREMKRRCFWACWCTVALGAEPPRSQALCDMVTDIPLPAAFEDGGLTDGVGFELSPTMQEALSQSGKPLCHMAEIVRAVCIWSQVQSFIWAPVGPGDVQWAKQALHLEGLIRGATTYAQGCIEHRESATGVSSEDIELLVSIRSLHHLTRLLLHAAMIPAFAKHQAAAVVTIDDISKSAEVVFKEANSIVQLFLSLLSRKKDASRLWPLSGHAAFISGVVLLVRH
ncbi:uncharacterized protein MYCFIDRAFT_85016 [Pseudocercospora fijiensis CIRAD86]|uniref:Zn(2)-C6 fungal-type domain-containing protein n=1 Tax=Pseudocercospora fijiensis (strain CIRAD86) TaxID=383855 RepID=N1Q7D9_PSEFD|nr:uncharacterized protein MYCFIDRAFT_85016 [Pseudocercospora fijiensis CIRAD86]EME88570.1 hypothetical protein MYCFIDRAFT_85016 [Pseudocercospora fijiensis CIRAD86]